LVPARARSNLYVLRNGLVTKLLWTNTTTGIKVTGVSFNTKDSSCPVITATATRETILSAGALGTPKILQQSGIGKAADLQAFNIPQIKELPVGDNFQDHVTAVMYFKGRPNAPAVDITTLMNSANVYLNNRTGSFSSFGMVDYNGFVNVNNKTAGIPDVQFMFYRFDRYQQDFVDILTSFGYKDEYITQLKNVNDQVEVIVAFVLLLKPKSRGTVKLRSADPNDAPKITTNYLEDADDRATLLAGYRQLQEIFSTAAMTSNNVTQLQLNISECDSLTYDSDDYVDCYFRYFTSSMWHPAGTAKMGNSSDPGAVVDERLRVRGIQKLRVADASIMPTVPRSNTQCPVYAIGEKAAIMIKADNP